MHSEDKYASANQGRTKSEKKGVNNEIDGSESNPATCRTAVVMNVGLGSRVRGRSEWRKEWVAYGAAREGV